MNNNRERKSELYFRHIPVVLVINFPAVPKGCWIIGHGAIGHLKVIPPFVIHVPTETTDLCFVGAGQAYAYVMTSVIKHFQTECGTQVMEAAPDLHLQ